MTARTEGTLALSGWRRRVFVLLFWPVVFGVLCVLGLAVGVAQRAAAESPSGYAPAAMWNDSMGDVQCVLWHSGPTYDGGTRRVRCNYGGGDVASIVSLNAGSGQLDLTSCTQDLGGVLCVGGPASSRGSGVLSIRISVPMPGYAGCTHTGTVAQCPVLAARVTVAHSKGSAVPPAYAEEDLVCDPLGPCLVEEDMCDNLAFSGPLPGMPWNGGEAITITVTIPEGVGWPNLYFYWPGTSFHPDRWWDPETGYPRDPQYDYPLLTPGDVEVPRFFVAYPDRWAYPENPFEPLTWAADGTETIKIRRLPEVRDGTVGELKIACAFALADGWHLTVRSWDGSEPATPTDFRECQDLAIDRPNWAEGDPNYPEDPGPWRVFARNGAAFGPVDVEVWDPETGVWVAWLDDLTLTAGEVVEEPESVPTVALTDPDSYSFRCTDAEGTLTGGTLGEVSPEKWADGSKESCTASGIGVAPSSWVPGLVKMGSCVTRKLFVPSDVELQRIRSAGAEASHRAPISFIAEPGGVLISAFSDAPATIEAHREDCLLLVDVSTLLDGVDDVSACPHSLEVSGSSASLSQLRAVLVTVWWLAFAWFLWSSTRRVMNL